MSSTAVGNETSTVRKPHNYLLTYRRLLLPLEVTNCTPLTCFLSSQGQPFLSRTALGAAQHSSRAGS